MTNKQIYAKIDHWEGMIKAFGTVPDKHGLYYNSYSASDIRRRRMEYELQIEILRKQLNTKHKWQKNSKELG